MLKLARITLGCLSVLWFVGCESGASISGTVTTKGEKVTSGNLTFTPLPAGKSASAAVKEDGTYSLKGVGSGKNTVIFAPASSTEPVALKPGEKVKPAPFEGLQVKTAEVDVKPGVNTIEIELVPRK